MTTLLERSREEVVQTPRRSYVAEWVAGIIGVLAAAVGAWMYFVPADWFLGGLEEGWYLGMLIGAGVVLSAVFGRIARVMFLDDDDMTARVVTFTTLSVLALVAAVTFAVIWIL